MSKFEAIPPVAIENPPGTGQSQAAAFYEQFTAQDREFLIALGKQLETGKKEKEAQSSNGVQEDLQEINPESLREDMPTLQETIKQAQEDFENRLHEFQEAHPEVTVEEIEAGDLYSDAEIAVMNQENEKLKEKGIDWGMIWTGAKIVGGVGIAIGLGYLLTSGLGISGLSSALSIVMEKMVKWGSKGTEIISNSAAYIGKGVTAVVDNIKSWHVWTSFNDWLGTGVAEGLEQGADMAPGPGFPEILPPNTFHSPMEPLPPLS